MKNGPRPEGRLRAVLTLLVALAAVVVAPAPAPASPIPPMPELWVMDATGENPVRLAEGSWSDSEFDWSPDATRIAFAQFSDIYVAGSDGTNAANVTSTPHVSERNPTWSPDGQQLAFAALGIEISAADGSNRRRVTSANDSLPESSPDGTRIAFIRTTGPGPGRLHSVAPDGTALQLLSQSDAGYIRPAWSPDGTQIAFATYHGDLRVVSADGTREVDVTGELSNVVGFSWSPDGSQIAFAAEGAIYIVNSDGTERRLVVPAPAAAPSWSPAGDEILFSRSGDLYVVQLDGSGLTRLTESDLRNETFPRWSPDGRKVAFISTEVQVLCGGFPWPLEATIIGTNGDDELEGTTGVDVIAGRGGNDTIRGLGGDDFICGDAGADTVFGDEGNDAVFGGQGSDILRGDAGDDELEGGGGADDLDGGAGSDAATYMTAPRPVTVNLAVGRARGWGRDVLSSIENVFGSWRGDRLIGDGRANELWGAQPFFGDKGDVIRGRGGSDTLYGLAGSDAIHGGRGNDHLDGDFERQRMRGSDALVGGRGRDTCVNGERTRGCETRR